MPPMRVTFIPHNSSENIDEIINDYINDNRDVWEEPENNYNIITIIYNGDLTENELKDEVEDVLEATVIIETI
ncbi:hypothetical protein B5C26_17695 [Photorhabdus luminescens]|uniref:Uncharacterized protein n=1 Tax=Photorhabdus luminescens subsp. mexicana TaxID=2100167 RepID=A0A4R4JJ72_PHOLU|nr:hypothetical protein [Photorhabdus luminescens]OWO80615.1 hypothetical protein B5C26_17695 [Photorhabdus luminescens]TDB54340.1 hypothetical protein C5468_04005 [Photorhabdus luminescens subsp. mexicana]